MWKLLGWGILGQCPIASIFGTVSHCTPVLVSQSTPNGNNFYWSILGKMGSPDFSFHTHSLQSSYLCYYYLNDISSTKQLRTVKITKGGNKITMKVEKVTFLTILTAVMLPS